MSEINSGDYVRIPDGGIARIRDVSKNGYRVRVKIKIEQISSIS